MLAVAGEPEILEPGNKSSQPLTRIFNIAFGALALFGIKGLWFAGRNRRDQD